MSCVFELRLTLIAPPVSGSEEELSRLLGRLFAGFGPDWATLSKLTGLEERRIKVMLAKTHNLGRYKLFMKRLRDANRFQPNLVI